MSEQATVVDERDELQEDLLRLRALVEEGDVEGARTLARELAAAWPEDRRVQHWARVLAPPRVLGTSPASGCNLPAEHEWLRAHAAEYPGCWIAVQEGRLIAASPDLKQVRKAAAEAGAVDPLLWFQPDPERWP
jgi:hypothetical protein